MCKDYEMNDGEATVPLVADDGTELISRADSNADRGAKEDTEDLTVSILKQGYCGSVRGNPRLMRMGEWKDKSRNMQVSTTKPSRTATS